MIKDQRSLHRRAGLCSLQEAGIEVGQQSIAQLDRGSYMILDDVTERPGVLINIADLGVVAAEQAQGAVLHPAQEQRGIGVARKPPDVGSDEGLPRDSEASTQRDAQPQMIPSRRVVTHPVRGVTLN